jgi:hypothetical protein
LDCTDRILDRTDRILDQNHILTPHIILSTVWPPYTLMRPHMHPHGPYFKTVHISLPQLNLFVQPHVSKIQIRRHTFFMTANAILFISYNMNPIKNSTSPFQIWAVQNYNSTCVIFFYGSWFWSRYVNGSGRVKSDSDQVILFYYFFWSDSNLTRLNLGQKIFTHIWPDESRVDPTRHV